MQSKTAANSSSESMAMSVGLLPIEEAVLSTLKDLLELGISNPPLSPVANCSGFSGVLSLGFIIAMRRLGGTHMFIEYPDSKTIRLTDRGIREIGPVRRPASNNEVHDRIRRLLGARDSKIFNQLASDGRSHVGHEVAVKAGYHSVYSIGYVKAVSTMRALGILEYSSNDTDRQNKLLRLTKLSFPYGRPVAKL